MARTDWGVTAQIIAACQGFEGIAPGYLNALAGTVGGANTVAINTGAAMVDGRPYLNSTSVNVNIPSAVGGGNTRIDRIVLRANWTAQTVRIYRIAGTDAATPSVPNIVQTSGTTYDIKLYQALVNTSGTVTLTDERVMASEIAHRQGGSATIWSTPGSTNYDVGNKITQVGTKTGNAAGDITVTFPTPFAYAPVVVCQSTVQVRIVALLSVSATNFVFATYDVALSLTTNDVFWIAIGPA